MSNGCSSWQPYVSMSQKRWCKLMNEQTWLHAYALVALAYCHIYVPMPSLAADTHSDNTAFTQ
jgi:hypothetical protein